jgi:acetyl esterase/lipase
MAKYDTEKMAQINPEFAELLKGLPKPPPVTELNFSDMRELLAARKAALNKSSLAPSIEDLLISEDTVPARDGYDIPIRTYRPKVSPEGGSPLVVWAHGGGFCIGDLDNEDLYGQLFAKEYGCAVVNPAYRLAPEHPFPAAVLDTWDVLKWVGLLAEPRLIQVH